MPYFIQKESIKLRVDALIINGIPNINKRTVSPGIIYSSFDDLTENELTEIKKVLPKIEFTSVFLLDNSFLLDKDVAQDIYQNTLKFTLSMGFEVLGVYVKNDFSIDFDLNNLFKNEIKKYLKANDLSVYYIQSKDYIYPLSPYIKKGLNNFLLKFYQNEDEFLHPMYKIMPSIAQNNNYDNFVPSGDTFSESLFKYIDRLGKKDSEIYKKANIDRRLFSKIRSNINYQPKKSTALALSIGLELNLDQTKDLIGCAGYALSRSIKRDVIIEYFIRNEIYDINEINEFLYEEGEEILS